jgi:hypothetical protein
MIAALLSWTQVQSKAIATFMGPKKSLILKTYRLVLNSSGVVFVDAEAYIETETVIAFNRSGQFLQNIQEPW